MMFSVMFKDAFQDCDAGFPDMIPDTEVLKRAGMQSMHTLVKRAQLRWTGHVSRMPDDQRKSSTENSRWESAPKVARRKATKTP